MTIFEIILSILTSNFIKKLKFLYFLSTFIKANGRSPHDLKKIINTIKYQYKWSVNTKYNNFLLITLIKNQCFNYSYRIICFLLIL